MAHMASESVIPLYLVDAYTDPVAVKVTGRASYTNCGPINSFLQNQIKTGKYNFVIDLKDCTALDSTFLGMLAGIAMELRKEKSRGELILQHVEARNLEIIENLGLHRIISVNPKTVKKEVKINDKSKDILKSMDESAVANPEMILKAHENLIKIDDNNLNRFQDVISYLKKQIKEEKESEED